MEVAEVYAMLDGKKYEAHQHSDGTFKCFPAASTAIRDDLVEKVLTLLREEGTEGNKESKKVSA
jgi:hypothetical protein